MRKKECRNCVHFDLCEQLAELSNGEPVDISEGYCTCFEEPDRYRWISVRENVPEDQEEVLVCTRSKNGCRNIDKGYWSIDHFIHRGTAEVTHWRPLPKFPEDAK